MKPYVSLFEGFASRGSHKVLQKTVEIGGQKVKIKAYPRTWYANPVGWNITINGEKIYTNVLDPEKAIAGVIEKYKKAHGIEG